MYKLAYVSTQDGCRPGSVCGALPGRAFSYIQADRVSYLEEEKASGFEAYGRHAQRVERVERVGDVESVLVAFSTEFLSFIASILVLSRSRTYGSIPRVFPY